MVVVSGEDNNKQGYHEPITHQMMVCTSDSDEVRQRKKDNMAKASVARLVTLRDNSPLRDKTNIQGKDIVKMCYSRGKGRPWTGFVVIVQDLLYDTDENATRVGAVLAENFTEMAATCSARPVKYVCAGLARSHPLKPSKKIIRADVIELLRLMYGTLMWAEIAQCDTIMDAAFHVMEERDHARSVMMQKQKSDVHPVDP